MVTITAMATTALYGRRTMSTAGDTHAAARLDRHAPDRLQPRGVGREGRHEHSATGIRHLLEQARVHAFFGAGRLVLERPGDADDGARRSRLPDLRRFAVHGPARRPLPRARADRPAGNIRIPYRAWSIDDGVGAGQVARGPSGTGEGLAADGPGVLRGTRAVPAARVAVPSRRPSRCRRRAGAYPGRPCPSARSRAEADRRSPRRTPDAQTP